MAAEVAGPPTEGVTANPSGGGRGGGGSGGQGGGTPVPAGMKGATAGPGAGGGGVRRTRGLRRWGRIPVFLLDRVRRWRRRLRCRRLRPVRQRRQAHARRLLGR